MGTDINLNVQLIETAIYSRYPYLNPSQAHEMRDKVLGYVAQSFSEGFDMAFIKNENGQAIINILKLVEEGGL